jgi:hypothetical protein
MNRRCALQSGHRGKCRAEGATNTVANGAINTVESAINTTLADAINRNPAPKEASMPKGGMQAMIDAIQDRTPNRRKREDYNAYMKRKMKERREEEARLKRAGFIGIAYG